MTQLEVHVLYNRLYQELENIWDAQNSYSFRFCNLTCDVQGSQVQNNRSTLVEQETLQCRMFQVLIMLKMNT